ncbi:MAG: NAD(P)(+) transhydrogenase (Re/Si-specific) subunit beta [Planctomycetota bacterium]
MDKEQLIKLAYLVASLLFIFGLKGLTHPRTAVRGNQMGALGMLIAIIAVLVAGERLSPGWIVGGIAVGAVIGGTFALRIQMTAMPELVALFNGFGGIASALVAGVGLLQEVARLGPAVPALYTVPAFLSGIIGAVTFTGSLIAFLKLREVMKKNYRLPLQSAVNFGLLLLCLGLAAYIVQNPNALIAYWLLVGFAGILGVFLVVPIGGADMPVVIALLNSYSGLAASATGFVVENNVLIIAGSLVGASGLILTSIMCKAMNRSLANVLFGTMEVADGDGPSADDVYAGKVKASSAEEVAILFDTAQKVAIVPGYGMAVAQCQHVVRDLANLLEDRGVEVVFGIHPVAGRMPGHMNVLLAEADVSYDKLLEMDEINTAFDQIDVTMVIGANDVVNPEARTNPNSPIAGMPILDVDKSRTVVVVKRSLSPGFAGIPNPLFAADNALMMFGDGKKAILELNAAIKEG